jgi:hypothetical protein
VSIKDVAYLKNAAALAPTTAAFLVLSKRFVGPPLGYDEQFFVWGGWSILKGLVPYKEFLEHKPPLAFLTHAIGLGLFGFENHRYRIFFLLLAIFSILGWQLALLSRGVDRMLSAVAGVGLVYLFVNGWFHDSALDDTESIGLAYYFFGVAFLLAKTPYRRAFDILGGAFLAACVLSKEPFVFGVAPTWATAYLARHRSADLKSARAYVRDTTIGVGIIALACCAYMIPTGSMTHYLAMLQRYRVMFRDPAKGYCVVLGRFQPAGTPLGDLSRQWDMVNAGFFNLRVLGFLVPQFFAALVFIGVRSKTLLVAGLITLAGALYSTTMSNCFWQHYYTMAMTGIFFFLSLGLIAMSHHAALRRWPVCVWVWLVMGVPVLLDAWPGLKAEYQTSYPSLPNAEPLPGVLAFVEANTTPADRIFTTGPPGLYILTNRIAATRTSSVTDEIIESFPGTTDEEKTRHLYDDLAEHRPKVVILDPEHGHRKVRYLAAAVMPFLRDFKYQKVNDYFYLRPDSGARADPN